VELDHEQKVIHVGCWFYDLKGVLIAEATEEDKKKYYCGKYMTYPIVDDDWRVLDDDCISDGIARLVIGKKDDTVPLIKFREVLDLNADERCGDYSDILMDAERHGITVANYTEEEPQKELPDTITLEIDKIRLKEEIYRIDSDWECYYVPRRFCHIGKDGKLYQGMDERENEGGQYEEIVYQIAEDVCGISWFFNKPHLKVRCQNIRCDENSQSGSKDYSIPEDWHISVKTLEDDINNEIKLNLEKHPDDYYHLKRPIL